MSEAIQLEEANPPGEMKPFGHWCSYCNTMHRSPNTAMGSCQRHHGHFLTALYRRSPSGPLFISEPVGVAPTWAADPT